MNDKKPTLLLVEDDNLQRRSIRRDLAHAGYEVSEAQDMQGAIAELDRHGFDIVICDLQLKHGETGLSVGQARSLQSPFFSGLNTVFIVYTAHPDYRTCVQAIKAGAYDYVSKLEDEAIEHLIQSCRAGLDERTQWATDPDVSFVQTHWEDLLAEYGERWVAVRSKEVIATNAELTALYATLQSQFPRVKPYIVHLERLQ